MPLSEVGTNPFTSSVILEDPVKAKVVDWDNLQIDEPDLVEPNFLERLKDIFNSAIEWLVGTHSDRSNNDVKPIKSPVQLSESKAEFELETQRLEREHGVTRSHTSNNNKPLKLEAQKPKELTDENDPMLLGAPGNDPYAQKSAILTQMLATMTKDVEEKKEVVEKIDDVKKSYQSSIDCLESDIRSFKDNREKARTHRDILSDEVLGLRKDCDQLAQLNIEFAALEKIESKLKDDVAPHIANLELKMKEKEKYESPVMEKSMDEKLRQEKLKKLETSLSAIKAEIKPIMENIRDIEAKKREIEEKRIPLRNAEKKLPTQESQLERAEQELAELTSKTDEIKTKQSALKSMREGLRRTEKQHTYAQAELTSCRRALEAHKKALEAHKQDAPNFA